MGIRVDVTPGVDRTKKTEVAIAAGTPPDTGVPMGGAFITRWAANGEVEPLDSYIAAAKLDLKVFVAPLVHEATYQGKVHGLPLLFNDRAILWNKNELAQAGLNADEPPASLEDMLLCAEKLTKTDASDKLTQLGFSKGPNAQPLPVSPVWSTYSSELQKALDSVFQGKTTAQVALTNVKQVIQPRLDTWLQKTK